MDEQTKVYRRGRRNFQTTIPGAVLFSVSEAHLAAGHVRVRWSWNSRIRKWTVEFPVIESEEHEKKEWNKPDEEALSLG